MYSLESSGGCDVDVFFLKVGCFFLKKGFNVELFYRELGGLFFDEKINENMVNFSC